MRVLVTGASGSIGARFCATSVHEVVATDLLILDVTSRLQAVDWALRTRPDAIVHLAAHKHAPAGELRPEQVTRVNVEGTANMVHAAQLVGANLVVASTCKACDPETAYGASKLIAERITLNAGGVVARFHNVRETAGNVFELWRSNPGPVGWTDCFRYFITVDQACSLLEACLSFPPGRYSVDPGRPLHMADVAGVEHPDRELIEMPLRRGDRRREPLHAEAEQAIPYGGFLKISGSHDPVGHVRPWREQPLDADAA